jgi:hypothetical protein
VSNQPERAEKTCLNCHAKLVGRFCHVCGQENIVTKQNFWSLSKHFIYDVFHFDGKFFDTLKYLLFSPGKVPEEYTAGKRVSFLDPIRMYLFTSAVFFLLFYFLGDQQLNVRNDILTPQERKDEIKLLRTYVTSHPSDSTAIKLKISQLEDTSRQMTATDLYEGIPFQLNGHFYHSVDEYDSLQNTLSDSSKESGVKRIITRKLIHLHASRGLDPNAALTAFWDDFAHNFPYILFLSLPFFAGILKLLYIRRKDLFYSDHAILTIYHYIVSFILLFLLIALRRLDDWAHWQGIRYFGYALAIWWMMYLFLSMRRFYRQSWLKTFFKFALVSLLAATVLIILFILFFFFTAYQL